MDKRIAVKVDKVSKKYCKSLKRSMLYGIIDISKNVLGLSSHSGKLRKKEFWAVKNVSFELKKGEVLGVIGPNGSGKTTLLKMLNGIFWPDKGKITVVGRVGALIEVGAGFHPLLTGRENIYINGAIIGMSKKEIDRKFDRIVEFAGIGDFLDSPVKNYSSGMFVRLGFAIAVHCEPDILLIDEILAVGDIGFRVKCYNKIEELKKKCAVIIVSHNIYIISRIASEFVVLSSGDLIYKGPPEKAIHYYTSLFDKITSRVVSGGVSLKNYKIKAEKEDGCYIVFFKHPLEIELELVSERDFDAAVFIMTFSTLTGDFVAEWNSYVDEQVIKITKGNQLVAFSVGPLSLNPGIYNISLTITSQSKMEHLLVVYRKWNIKIIGEKIGLAPYQISGKIRKHGE